MGRKTNQTTPPKSTTDDVKQYALDVVSGKEVAGPLVRLAGERHLRDLVDGEKRGLFWDQAWADRTFGYFKDVLRLAGGEDEGRPFILQPAQKFIVGSLFGWKNANGYYRFTTAYIEMGKGGGKSPLAGGIGLLKMSADGEKRAQVFTAATDKDQAKIPFLSAVAMVDQSPALSSRIVKSPKDNPDPDKVWNLAHIESHSSMRPIASESMGRGKSGFRPYCVILDEVHEHPTDAMVEFMRKNIKGRPNALVLMITNSGVYNVSSVCWRYHQYSEALVRGTVEPDDEFFSFTCSLDKGDSWQDPAVWKKANPLLGVTIPYSYLEKEVREAKGMPSKQSLTRRLNFCEWVESANPFVTVEVWDSNGGKIPAELLIGRKCFGGLDLSGKNDLTALVLVFPMPDGSKAVLSFFWTPKDTLIERADRDRAPYQQWVDEKYLVATPGRSIDYGFVALQISELNAMYQIEGIAFDKHRIEDLERELEDINVEVKLIPHGQTHVDMDPAIEALEDDLLEARLRHAGHPVLKSCVMNAKVVEDASTNRRFDKRNSTGRIDGAQALAMADNLSQSYVPEPEPIAVWA